MGQVGWIKVNTNIFSNRKIKILLKEREGDTYFRIWIQILTIAGECNRDGGLYISDNTPFKIKDFTNITGKSSKTFTKILQKFIDLGMLYFENDTYIQPSSDFLETIYLRGEPFFDFSHYLLLKLSILHVCIFPAYLTS